MTDGVHSAPQGRSIPDGAGGDVQGRLESSLGLGAGVWRTDFENAPRGRTVEQPGPKGSTRSVHKPELVILACADGKTVTVSRWLPEEQRWNMLSKNERPRAWLPFPVHPDFDPCTAGYEGRQAEVNSK